MQIGWNIYFFYELEHFSTSRNSKRPMINQQFRFYLCLNSISRGIIPDFFRQLSSASPLLVFFHPHHFRRFNRSQAVECHSMYPALLNPLMGTRNYSATSNDMKLVHYSRWWVTGGLLHLVQRGGDWEGPQPPRPLLSIPNVTAQPPMASVPITV